MSVTLEVSYGRTRHDIELLSTLLAVGTVPVNGKDNIAKGYAKQREKTIKTLLANIFRKSNKSQMLKTYGCTCTVNTPTGSLTIPPGYISEMYFGTFPFVTNVILTDKFGNNRQFFNLGNVDFV